MVCFGLQKCGLFNPLDYLGRFFNRFEKILKNFSSTLQAVNHYRIVSHY